MSSTSEDSEQGLQAQVRFASEAPSMGSSHTSANLIRLMSYITHRWGAPKPVAALKVRQNAPMLAS